MLSRCGPLTWSFHLGASLAQLCPVRGCISRSESELVGWWRRLIQRHKTLNSITPAKQDAMLSPFVSSRQQFVGGSLSLPDCLVAFPPKGFGTRPPPVFPPHSAVCLGSATGRCFSKGLLACRCCLNVPPSILQGAGRSELQGSFLILVG